MSDDDPHRSGDDLIARILAGAGEGSGTDLLKECWRGFPVERLSSLLRSDVDSAVATGVWLAAELAKQARPLLHDVEPLLGHLSTNVRSEAIDAVNLAATADDGEIVARAIEHITDCEQPVRYAAFQLLAAGSREKIEAGCGFIRDEPIRRALGTVLDEEATVSGVAIRARLADDSELVRLFGLLSAARISDRRAEDLLAAVEEGDEEIKLFAFREARRRRLVPPTKFEDRAGS